jgi:hypothetical protein
MSPKFLLVTMLVVTTHCTSQSAQDSFEAQARKMPSGITRTDAVGRIISIDPDDWRIGPMFGGYVEVSVPAYPNPSRGERITIDILVSGLESVNRLQVYTRTPTGSPLFLYEINDSPLPTGLNQIYLDPAAFAQTRSYQDAIGLHRVFVYDQNANLITYGDIQID